ncbi:MAG TPA: alkaline phosphatase family protein [Candidatus Acidoferrales bacterium]|nr:alkaline phosphatase family protein [Candidatus Acidoferrales bacterium]
MKKLVIAGTLFFAVSIAGCKGSVGGFGSSGLPPLQPAVQGKHFKHIVVIVQENRTFDNLFATFPGADGATKGKTRHGTIPLHEADLGGSVAPNNGHQYFLRDLDGGKMDGFAGVPIGNVPGSYVYQYVNPSQIAPYWALARQYVLADHFFQTQGSGSFTAHQDLIAAGTQVDATHSLIDFPTALPWGCDAPPGTVTSLVTKTGLELPNQGPFPCLSYRTLRDSLDAAGVSWRYYTPAGNDLGGAMWSAFDAIAAVRHGPEWGKNVAWPETLVFDDIKDGTLPDVSWVIPDYANSDHPGNHSGTGPSWVAQVVDAVGESKAWNTTAIVIVWDDWGGWYDHVVPPKPYASGGLGFRVPAIVVSPYAKKGYVSHEQYEFGSIVRFIEDNWNLPQLGTTDVRSSDFLSDFFDFAQPPRAFVPIAAPYGLDFFERQRPSGKPVDDE